MRHAIKVLINTFFNIGAETFLAEIGVTGGDALKGSSSPSVSLTPFVSIVDIIVAVLLNSFYKLREYKSNVKPYGYKSLFFEVYTHYLLENVIEYLDVKMISHH